MTLKSLVASPLILAGLALVPAVSLAGEHYSYPKVEPGLLEEGSSVTYLSDRDEVMVTAEAMFKGKVRKLKGFFKKIKTPLINNVANYGEYAGGPYLITEKDGEAWRAFFTKTRSGSCFYVFRRDRAFAPDADGSRVIFSQRMEASVITPVSCVTVDQVNRSALIPGFEEFQPLSEAGRAQLLRLNGTWSANKRFTYIQTDRNPEYPSAHPYETEEELSYSSSLKIEISDDLTSAKFSSQYSNYFAGNRIWGSSNKGLAGNLIPAMYREIIEANGSRTILLWANPMIPLSTDSISLSFIPEKIALATSAADFLPLNADGKCYVFEQGCNVFRISQNSLVTVGGDILLFSDVIGGPQPSFQVQGYGLKDKVPGGKLRIVNTAN